MFIFSATAFANAVPDIVSRALLLARYGFAVFPLRSGKRPFGNMRVAAALSIPAPPEGQGGAKLATRDPAAIQRLWMAFPNAMIGIATGAASGGVIVLDVDRKNGRDGFQTLASLGFTLPQTAWVQTPSGGYHYFYRGPAGQHSPTDGSVLGEALDRRGDGGYVVDYGFDPTAPIASAPEWLLRGGSQHVHRERRTLGDPALAAPSFEDAVVALNAHDPNDLDHDKWIAITAQFKQSVSTLVSDEVARLAWDLWCNRYDKNDPADNGRQWNSIRVTSSGWTSLRDGSPKRAELIFGEPSQQQLQVPQPMQIQKTIDGYEKVIKTATGDNGKNTLIETVKLLHGKLPIVFDQFTQTIVATHPLPWDGDSKNYPRQWIEKDTITCQLFAQALYIRPGKDTVHDAITIIADRHKVHQVRDYLNTLQWDRRSRLQHLMHRYFGATDNEYTRAIGTRFMIGAIARVMDPGCKMDNVLILEGAQGKLKSSSIAALVGAKWFTDELPDLHTKDAAIQLLGKWVIEVSELSALRRAEVETIKKFMSRSVDRYRAPYERDADDHPRQCVFVATTNDEEYLKDQTGNRRFWPIKIGAIDFDAIKRDRDQLWAESTVRYLCREQWWLTANEELLAQAEQDERREVDLWEDRIIGIANATRTVPITIGYIAIMMGLHFSATDTRTNKRIAHVLKRNGYKRRQFSENGARVWKYEKP